jgi:hypothetical protein
MKKSSKHMNPVIIPLMKACYGYLERVCRNSSGILASAIGNITQYAGEDPGTIIQILYRKTV